MKPSRVLRFAREMFRAMSVAVLSIAASGPHVEAASARETYPEPIRVILENARALKYPLAERLPLFLWPAHGGIVQDELLQESIIRDLAQRGIAMIATWNPGKARDKSLQDSVRIARIQQRLGLRVCVNANACMVGFFTGDPETAHLDDQGKPFFDSSIPGGKIGCPFRISQRFPSLRENVEFFVNQYRKENLRLDFVFGDWEIDGPLEVNRAWEFARRCVVCQKNIASINDFRAFQKAVREKRGQATHECYTAPILNAYPDALVGNYAVYPNDGFRYWFDYFETFYEAHPHRFEQKAPYRIWYNDYPLSGYTMAMPVIYPWSRIHDWYDYANSDYRWLHNMLLVASNAGKHTDSSTPIVPFIHWHTVFDPDRPNSRIQQMSEKAYEEMLWHVLLRGADTFFMWCAKDQAAKEVSLAHEVWAESLNYADWLSKGESITFSAPPNQSPVVSGILLGNRVLCRRTDFDDEHPAPIQLAVTGKILTVPKLEGIQILDLP